MTKLIILLSFFFVGTAAFAQQSQDSSEMRLEIGAGLDQLINPSFVEFLSANSMTDIDLLRCWRMDWRATYISGPIYMALGSSRMSNFMLGPYGVAQRTKLTWDSTRLSVGLMIVDLDVFALSFGAGVSVSKFLLQAYGNDGGSFSSIYGGTGNIDLVSGWNWSPEIEADMGVMLFSLAEDFNVWLRAGVQGGWQPLPVVWRLFDDPEVTGVPKPAEFYLRYSVWIGLIG